MKVKPEKVFIYIYIFHTIIFLVFSSAKAVKRSGMWALDEGAFELIPYLCTQFR